MDANKEGEKFTPLGLGSFSFDWKKQPQQQSSDILRSALDCFFLSSLFINAGSIVSLIVSLGKAFTFLDGKPHTHTHTQSHSLRLREESINKKKR